MKKILITLFLIPLCSFSQLKSFEDVTSQENTYAIQLIVDAYELFNSDASANIIAENSSLSYIAIKSLGGGIPRVFIGEEIKNNENYSDASWGQNVAWTGRVTGLKSAGYKIRITQIELPPGNCAFPNLHYPGVNGNVNAGVNDAGPGTPKECLTRYDIWFELENPNGETRSFRLDPWVLVK